MDRMSDRISWGAIPLALGIALALACALACSRHGGDGSGGTTTASGLTLTHEVVGKGIQPGPKDVVVVHYQGSLADGTVFDSSIQRGQPARFPLNRVIPCWKEALQMMRVGGKAKVVCPPDIAYGARGAPPRIPPNATLTFEVQLLDVVR